jgi:transcriptional regulator with XRE-family HTH domain
MRTCLRLLPLGHEHMSNTISSYLRTHRRRSGLTQAEVSFLLVGKSDDAQLARYERLSRMPSLHTAIGLQVIFGLATKDILPREFIAVEQKVVERAHMLSRRLEQETNTALTRRKLQFLSTIISRRERAARHRLWS